MLCPVAFYYKESSHWLAEVNCHMSLICCHIQCAELSHVTSVSSLRLSNALQKCQIVLQFVKWGKIAVLKSYNLVEAGIRYLHLVRTPICWIVLLQKSLTWLVKFRSEPISIPSSLIFWDRSNLTPPDVPFLLPSTIDWLKRELKASSAEQVVRKKLVTIKCFRAIHFQEDNLLFYGMIALDV